MKKDSEFSDAFNGKPKEEIPTEMPAAEAPAPEMPAEPMAEMDTPAPEAEMPAMDAPVADAEPEMSPEDVQREKSWEGRLRKREEELAAREAAMADGGETGERSEAMATLADQFGEEFAVLIKTVIMEVVKDIGPQSGGDMETLREEVSEVIEDLKFAMNKRDILAAKSDAYEIGESPEFQEWCSNQDDADECKRIVEGGTANEVIELLTRYEKSLGGEDDKTGEDMDAATAVRSSAPITIPPKPSANPDDEYKAAWDRM